MRYDWTRFWSPREAYVRLGYDGYLPDPEELGQYYNPFLIAYTALAQLPCLILLGEQGSGKSDAVQAEQAIIENDIQLSGNCSQFIDLRSFGSEERLHNVLFGSKAWTEWQKGNYLLHLTLDSLDEALLRVNTLANIIADELGKCDINRLRLRIACRSVDWPVSLEHRLKDLWGNEAVGVYELAPLRRKDVLLAAQQNEIGDIVAFMKDIERMNATPFAIKPVTLNFLLKTYKKGKLPDTQKMLYTEGCRLLCQETNQSRRDAKLFGKFDSDERLAVAARIAALIQFGSKASVYRGVDESDALNEDLCFRELRGKTELVGNEKIKVNEASIRATLASGLFSLRGLDRFGLTHQTYAEFLAAYWVAQSGMSLPQVMSLFIHAGDAQGKLVPQLRATAGWLASMSKEVFKAVEQIEPDVLLQSDLAEYSNDDRVRLVDAILKPYEQGRVYTGYSGWGNYVKLKHPQLEEQLRSYLIDDAKPSGVKIVAIQMAETCEVSGLADNIAGIALDSSASEYLRCVAANAVTNIGDNTVKSKLKSLLFCVPSDDPDDSLKSEALKALWPDLLSAEELFQALTPPKNKNFIGSYHTFLANNIAKHFKTDELPLALDWVIQQPRYSHSHPYYGLAHEIMVRAWQDVTETRISKKFAEAILRLTELHDSVNCIADDVERRHCVVEALLPLLAEKQEALARVVFYRFPLLTRTLDEVEWLITKLSTVSTERMRELIGELIHCTIVWGDLEQLALIEAAKQNYPILTNKLSWVVSSVKLHSPEAQQMREQYEDEQRQPEPEEELPELKPSVLDRVEECLRLSEQGDLNSWWHLCRLMTWELDGFHKWNDTVSSLITSAVWKATNDLFHARMIDAAVKYLVECSPKTSTWISIDTFSLPVLAGYKALRLLLEQTPTRLERLDANVWQKWAEVTLSYPDEYKDSNIKMQQFLVSKAYKMAADEVIHALEARMKALDEHAQALSKQHEFDLLIRRLELCWDTRIGNSVLTKAQNATVDIMLVSQLLSVLLLHKHKGARDWVASLVQRIPFESEAERSMALMAARLLITRAEDVGWSVLWPKMQEDSAFGRALVNDVAPNHNSAENLCAHLNEEQIADLYLWLTEQFPVLQYQISEALEDADGDGFGMGQVTPQGEIAMWKSSVLNSLVRRGTFTACKELGRLADDLPDEKWIRSWQQEAEETARRSTWSPPRPADILALAQSSKSRLVRNSYELLELILEALRQLEQELHGETPMVEALWNEIDTENYRWKPKNENRFSDYVKNYLQKYLKPKGVVLGREVEIRPTQGKDESKADGEVTDIYVSAVVANERENEYEKAAVIIEVKGCWNTQLKTAMETQLVNRYLKNNLCQYGLYLVGWFNCSQWSDGPKISKDEAQKMLDDQAATLSKGGRLIQAFVMNTALREPTKRPNQPAKGRKQLPP